MSTIRERVEAVWYESKCSHESVVEKLARIVTAERQAQREECAEAAMQQFNTDWRPSALERAILNAGVEPPAGPFECKTDKCWTKTGDRWAHSVDVKNGYFLYAQPEQRFCQWCGAKRRAQ